MNTAQKKISRRSFLFALGAGSAAGAAALVARERAKPSEQAAAPGGRRGYRLTEHVKKYYRSARV